jgi:hypothetical protein
VLFSRINLNETMPRLGDFDMIMLRNLMICFDMTTKRLLRKGGFFLVNHSECPKRGMRQPGRDFPFDLSHTMNRLVVMVIDDAAVMRHVMQGILEAEPDMQVLGAASDPLFVLDKMARNWPDVIVPDIGIPCMDGLTFLRKLMGERADCHSELLYDDRKRHGERTAGQWLPEPPMASPNHASA